MDIVGNNVDTLYEEMEHLVNYLVRNNVGTLYQERIYFVKFSFIRIYDI
jgi:hypothetical protein